MIPARSRAARPSASASPGFDPWRALWDAPREALLLLVEVYRLFFKAWVGNDCRFEPSCSLYAQQALRTHGALRGARLTAWRLMRCHPGCAGGCDPVPPAFGPFTAPVAPQRRPSFPPDPQDPLS